MWLQTLQASDTWKLGVFWGVFYGNKAGCREKRYCSSKPSGRVRMGCFLFVSRFLGSVLGYWVDS